MKVSNRTKKLLAVLALLWVVGVVLTPTLLADSFKNDSNLVVNDPINDSLFWGGSTAAINAPIDGDVFLGASDRVDINSTISGTVFIGAANNVNIGSNAKVIGTIFAGSQNITMAQGAEVRDLRIGGTTINISGKVDRNLSAGGTTINVNQGATIGRDAQIGGTSVGLNGSVGGNAAVGATDFSFGSSGSVEGKLSYAADNSANLQGRAGSTEKVTRSDVNQGTAGTFNSFLNNQGFQVGALIFGIISALVTGLLLLLIAPGAMRDSTLKLNLNWLPSLLWGLLVFILLPIIAVIILLITLATAWPISVALLALWTVLLILSGAVVGIALGNLLFRGRMGLWLEAIVGILLLQVLLWAAGAIPSVGGWVVTILNIFVAVLGFGGLLLVLWDGLRGHPVMGKMPTPPPPPPTYTPAGV